MGRDFLRSLVTGCAAGIAVASIDAVAGFVASAGRFDSLAFAAAAVGLVATLTLLVFLALRWLVVAPVVRGAPQHALSVATAMGVSAFLIVLELPLPQQPVPFLFELLVKLSIGGAVGAGAYALALVDERAQGATLSRVAGRMLPIVLPAALAAAWIGLVYLRDVTSLRFYLTLLILLAFTAAMARVVPSLGAGRWQVAVRLIFCAYVAAGAVAVALISSQALPATPLARGGKHEVRRVILLSVDTLRRDAVSAFGTPAVQTPAIDRLAGDGVVFRNMYASSSWTLPSFASMFTGLTTRGHGVVMSTTALPDTVVTLAERFRDAGYETHALVANAILAPHRGFAQGFQRYHLPEGSASSQSPVSLGEYLASFARYQPLAVETATHDLTTAAIRWVQSRRDRDFFLWVHYLDPHLPYSPPRRFVEKMNMHDEMGYLLEITSATRPTTDLFATPERRLWARSLYDGEVRHVDNEIGRFLDALRDADLYDDTLIIFAVDHGEEFWDHDGFEHGHTLYSELVGVPLIFKTPRAATPRVVDDPVGGYDVAPTVLELCGLRAVEAPRAVSLVPYLTGATPPAATRPLFASATLFRSNFESVVFDGWKYIRSATTNREELYRLGNDPGERTNLVLEHRDVVRRARALIDEHIRSSEAFRASRGISNPVFQLDKEEIERLRALGYI